MTERNQYADVLLVNYLQQSLTEAEEKELNAWIEASPGNRALFEQLQQTSFIQSELEQFYRYDEEKGWEKVHSSFTEVSAFAKATADESADKSSWFMVHSEKEADRPSFAEATAGKRESLVVNETQDDGPQTTDDSKAAVVRLWKRIAVAASIVGVLFVTGYWLMKEKTTDDGPQTTVIPKTDVPAPDRNRAQIKLEDGRIVYLDSAGNGELASMNGVVVTKTDDGKIEYSRESSVVSGEVKYNTLTNPRGSRVIDMTLSDGSRVWLNAGSSVTYPVAFVGNERKVEITGEGYFEVSPHPLKGGKKMPFIVSKGDVSVTVLGTHFNVNAYDDESEIKVTLLEGKVNVSTKYEVRGTILQPGEQAQAGDNIKVVKDVDVEQVMAWKNGQFVFGAGMTIEEIMRQLARWYDIDVVYERKMNVQLGGSISRNVNISEVLKILSLTGVVKFEVEGKKVTVR